MGHGEQFPRRFRVFVASGMLALASAGCAPAHGTIGAVLGQRPDGRLFVREVPGDLAAARKGLAPDDEILLIDGRDVRNLDERALQRALSGEVGTPVKITAVRNEEIVRVTLQRTPARRRKRTQGD